MGPSGCTLPTLSLRRSVCGKSISRTNSGRTEEFLQPKRSVRVGPDSITQTCEMISDPSCLQISPLWDRNMSQCNRFCTSGITEILVCCWFSWCQTIVYAQLGFLNWQKCFKLKKSEGKRGINSSDKVVKCCSFRQLSHRDIGDSKRGSDQGTRRRSGLTKDFRWLKKGGKFVLRSGICAPPVTLDPPVPKILNILSPIVCIAGALTSRTSESDTSRRWRRWHGSSSAGAHSFETSGSSTSTPWRASKFFLWLVSSVLSCACEVRTCTQGSIWCVTLSVWSTTKALNGIQTTKIQCALSRVWSPDHNCNVVRSLGSSSAFLHKEQKFEKLQATFWRGGKSRNVQEYHTTVWTTTVWTGTGTQGEPRIISLVHTHLFCLVREKVGSFANKYCWMTTWNWTAFPLQEIVALQTGFVLTLKRWKWKHPNSQENYSSSILHYIPLRTCLVNWELKFLLFFW